MRLLREWKEKLQFGRKKLQNKFMVKPKRVRTPNSSQDVEQWELLSITGGYAKIAQTLWRQFGNSYKAKQSYHTAQ